MAHSMFAYHAERIVWEIQELLEPLGIYWIAVPTLALVFVLFLMFEIMRDPG